MPGNGLIQAINELSSHYFLGQEGRSGQSVFLPCGMSQCKGGKEESLCLEWNSSIPFHLEAGQTIIWGS